MQTIEFDNKKTGWVSLPSDTKNVLAHFSDGSKETYSLINFVTLKKRTKDKIVSIECIK